MRRRRGSGTIECAPGGRHRVRLTTDAGRRSLGIYDTHEEAAAVLKAALVSVASDEPTPGLTLRGWGVTYLERRETAGTRGIVTDRGRWERHIDGSSLADLPIASIDRADVLAWLDVMLKKRAADKRGRRPLGRVTIQNTLNLLRVAFESAVERRILQTNPAAGVRVPRRPSTKKPWTFLAPAEQSALLAASPARERRAIAFALGSGLRQGEQWNIEIADVHLDAVPPHVVVRFGAKDLPPKNGLIRHVHLFGVALDAVREQLATMTKRAKKKSRALLWPTERGCRRQKGAPSAWTAWLELAGITRPVRWHDLRHTCASSLVAGWFGEPASLEAVKRHLGHSSVTVTERYAHLAPGAVRVLADVVPHVATQARVKPSKRKLVLRRLRGRGLKESRSHLRESNSRPTVYEDAAEMGSIAGLDAPQARAWAQQALEELAAGRHAALIALAAKILDATEPDLVREDTA